MAFLPKVLATFLLIQTAIAANIIVGGPNGGWDMNTDLKAWAEAQTFFPGDTLNFSFAPIHSVIEVPKTDYDACTVSGLLQSYTGGSAAVKLSSPGKRYFICGSPGHCAQGMKVEINTISASNAMNPPFLASQATPPPSISPPPPPASPVVIPTPTFSSPPATAPASPAVIPTPTITSPPPKPASPVFPTPLISSPSPKASHPIPAPIFSSPPVSPVIQTPATSSQPPSIQPPTASLVPPEAPNAAIGGDPPTGFAAIQPVTESPNLADSPATTPGPATQVAQDGNGGERQAEKTVIVLVVSLLMALVF